MFEREMYDRCIELELNETLTGTELNSLEAEVQWHWANIERACQEKEVLFCVSGYALGYRKRPSQEEIHEEYLKKREYWRLRHEMWEWKVLRIVVPLFVILLGLVVLWCMLG